MSARAAAAGSGTDVLFDMALPFLEKDGNVGVACVSAERAHCGRFDRGHAAHSTGSNRPGEKTYRTKSSHAASGATGHDESSADGVKVGNLVIDATTVAPQDGYMTERRVVFVTYPGCQSLDLTGPFEVFIGANRLAPTSKHRYRLHVASIDGSDVVTESGLRIGVDTALRHIRGPIDTLIVVGGTGAKRASLDTELTGQMTRLSKFSRRIASVCTGTYILGEADLLHNRIVCTHWASTSDFADSFPSTEVDPDSLFRQDGPIWTSAGVTAGIDLALALVEADVGVEIAQTIARWMVMFLRRPGGQSQFAGPAWRSTSSLAPIRAVQQSVEATPENSHSVSTMAAMANMSERNFIRVFTKETGTSPAKFVEAVRIETACRNLETTKVGVEEIAAACGFGTSETLRKAMLRAIGVTPTDYRQRFHTPPQLTPPQLTSKKAKKMKETNS